MATAYSYQELRGEGRGLNYDARSAAIARNSIRKVERLRREREKLGLDTSGQDRRLAELNASYDSFVGRYQERRERLGESYDAAVQAAPKNYRTDLRNQQQYTDSAGNYVPPNPVGRRGTSPGRVVTAEEKAQRQTSFARSAASQGLANYQSQTGEVYDVSYPTATPNATSEGPNYTAAYGYSTPQGEVHYSYRTVQENKSTPSFQEQRTADRQRLRQTLANYNENPKAAGEAFLEPFVTVPAGFVERGSQRAVQYFEQNPTGKANAAVGTWIFSRTEAIGKRYRTEPGQSLGTDAGLAVLGFGTGKLFGYGTKYAAGKFGYGAAAFSEKTLAFGTGGLIAYQTATSSPEEFASFAPGVVAGGFGFARGYRGVVGSPSVSVRPQSGTVTRAQFTENTISGTADLRYAATVKAYGVTKEVPVSSSALFTGQRVPGTNYFGVRAESQTAVPFGGKTAYRANDFAGVYNANTNVLALRNSRSVYVSQGARQSPAMYDGVSSIDRGGARFFTGQTSNGVTSVNRVGFTSGLVESNPVTRLQYRGAGGVSAFRPQTYSLSETNAVVRSGRAGGVDEALFRGGFQNLERAGLYRNQVYAQRPPARDMFVEQVKSFAGNRRGSYGGRTSVLQETRPPSNRFDQTTRLRQPRSFELSGLPVEFGRLPGGRTFFAFNPVTGSATRETTATRSDFYRDTKPASRLTPSYDTAITPAFDTRTSSAVKFDFKPDTRTIQRQTPQQTPFPTPGTIPRPQQPVIPPVIGFGIPNFGVGGGGVEGRGRGRNYEFAPSLSGLGLAQGNVLFGFESRRVKKRRRR